MTILDIVCFFFFFKRKTAYEISLGLVGSEMCIRDRTKLVRVVTGVVEDVLVDIRKGSPTYGQWEGYILSPVPYTHLTLPTILLV
ncbi:dTDP-4-dehydrorhamnose 3,5-epimerase [Lactobacillus paracasei ATCC 334] [Lacticaseibacillus rhamnosus]|nr:dTDP-4-dehydrorhamnose 3,5-epimerase [Lactobacillus paracasei ATCC 334] [Lacticaseibacillus rhamnosus]